MTPNNLYKGHGAIFRLAHRPNGKIPSYLQTRSRLLLTSMPLTNQKIEYMTSWYIFRKRITQVFLDYAHELLQLFQFILYIHD